MIIPRPEPTEAAPYYFTYIDQVGDTGVIETLRSQLDKFVADSSQITEETSLHRYAPGKWSIRELLNHLTDAERVFSFRALWFARGFETALPSFEQDVAVTCAEADRVAWKQHVNEFVQVRGSTIALFENMPRAAWLRRDSRVIMQSLSGRSLLSSPVTSLITLESSMNAIDSEPLLPTVAACHNPKSYSVLTSETGGMT